ALRADTIENACWLDRELPTALTLDDRDLVVALIPIGQGCSGGGTRNQCCCSEACHHCCKAFHDALRGYGPNELLLLLSGSLLGRRLGGGLLRSRLRSLRLHVHCPSNVAHVRGHLTRSQIESRAI